MDNYENTKNKKKQTKTVIITVAVIVGVITILCLLADGMWSSSGKHGKYQTQQTNIPSIPSNTQSNIDTQIVSVIKEFADKIRDERGGNVKYSNCSKYKIAKDGTQVYRIKYISSIESMFYYQLVSLDNNNTTVNKSSELFAFSTYGDGQKLELEYSYEKLWE